MTRNDFEVIAKALADARLVRDSQGKVQWWQVVELVSQACRQQNKRFDREKFLAACSQDAVEIR